MLSKIFSVRTAIAAAIAIECSLALPMLSLAQGLPPLTNVNSGYAPYTTGQEQPQADQSPISPNATSIYQAETVSLRGRVSTIPKGTMLMLKVDQPLSASNAHLGEVVSATLENDIFINDAIALPAGSQISGHVASVEAPSRLGKHGTLDVRFDMVKTPDGSSVPIRGHVVTSDDSGILKGDTYTKDVVKGVGIAAGGAGVGTLVGLSAGSIIGSAGAGAVLGLGVGALGGMSYALLRKGKDVELPTGSRVSVTLDQPVTVNL